MDLSQREESGVAIIDVVGEIDLYEAPMFNEMIDGLLQEGKRNFLINMEKVGYIDSSGIGALILCGNNLKDAGGLFKLCNVGGPVFKVFEATKLDVHFEIFNSVEEAVATFG